MLDFFYLSAMKSDHLISRKQAMTILEIRNSSKFKKLWSDGLLPAPLGIDGNDYLWSGAVVRQVKLTIDSGVIITEDLILNVSLDVIIRLIKSKSMKIS